MLRLLQEALNNIVKHAHARRVRFVTRDHSSYVEIRVEDDGNGFDIERPCATGAASRARSSAPRSWAASCASSPVGVGTLVSLRLPLERAAARPDQQDPGPSPAFRLYRTMSAWSDSAPSRPLTRAVGVGIHSGQKVELVLRPAAPDTGIVFRRVDLCPPVDIPVSASSVCDTRMATTISPGGDPSGPKVQTIEHLLSACAGLGLDNPTSTSMPTRSLILDGSAASFVFLLQSAGIELQNAPKKFPA